MRIMVYKIKSSIFGLFLIGLGVVFLLSNTGIIPLDFKSIVHTYWPVILMLLGVEPLVKFFSKLFKGRVKLGKLFWGCFWIGLGALLLGNNLNWFAKDINVWDAVWPTLIIYFGLSILFKRRRPRVVIKKNIEIDDSDYKTYDFDDWNEEVINGDGKGKKSVMIGQMRMGDQPWSLEDSKMSVGIGEIHMDLRKAFLNEGVTNLDLVGWIGDITLLVPENLPVNILASLKIGELRVFDNVHSGSPGTIEYRSEDYDVAAKKLNIRVKYSMGDIKIKRVD